MKDRGFLFVRNDNLQIDRLFDELIHHPWSGKTFNPDFDLYETEESYIYEADCPGMTIEDIHLSLSGDTLEIYGERKVQKEYDFGSMHFRERTYGKFYRSIPLSADIDRDTIRADMDRGVLRIYLHKLKDG